MLKICYSFRPDSVIARLCIKYKKSRVCCYWTCVYVLIGSNLSGLTLGVTETCRQRKTLTVPKIWVPKDPAVVNGTYTQKEEKEIFGPLAVPLQTVTLYFLVDIFTLIDAESLTGSDKLSPFYIFTQTQGLIMTFLGRNMQLIFNRIFLYNK